MGEISRFESREAVLSCTPEMYYSFITDLRNFDRFIPAETIRDWSAEKDKCRFRISTIGEIDLFTSEKVPCSLVVFSGNVLAATSFSLKSVISEGAKGNAHVRLTMEADLPPFIKMFASSPIQRFLETLVEEMEKFRSWT